MFCKKISAIANKDYDTFINNLTTINELVGATGFEPAIPREPKPLVRPSHRTPSYNNTNIFLLIRISNNNSSYLTKINNYKFLKMLLF